MGDTHDCDERIDGVEKCAVPVGLFLKLFYGSLGLKFVKESRNGGKLIGVSLR